MLCVVFWLVGIVFGWFVVVCVCVVGVGDVVFWFVFGW